MFVTDDWILDYVVPHMHHQKLVDRQICLVLLGRALLLLWYIFDESGNSVVPNAISTRVLMTAYADLLVLCVLENVIGEQQGTNPIMKVAISVDGVDSELVIDTTLFEDEEDEEDDTDNCGRGVRRRHIERHEVQFLQSQVMHLHRQELNL